MNVLKKLIEKSADDKKDEKLLSKYVWLFSVNTGMILWQ